MKFFDFYVTDFFDELGQLAWFAPCDDKIDGVREIPAIDRTRRGEPVSICIRLVGEGIRASKISSRRTFPVVPIRPLVVDAR